MRTWLFQCNPDRFQIDRFLATRPAEMNWLVRQHASEIEPGDRVFIWRAIGTGAPEESGVVAECEVLTRTEPMGDNGSVFWADPTEANVIEPRVALRIVHIADKRSMLPRSQLSDNSTLRGLRIFRLRNETNYALSAEEASRLSALWGENIGVGRNPTWVRDELILALDLPRPGNDPRRRRSPRSSRHDLRDERRELSPPNRPRTQAWTRLTAARTTFNTAARLSRRVNQNDAGPLARQ